MSISNFYGSKFQFTMKKITQIFFFLLLFLSFNGKATVPTSITNEVAQVSMTQNVDNDYVFTFSLRSNKVWSQTQFTNQCNRWMPEMVQTGALKNCAFNPTTGIVTAIFDGTQMSTGFDNVYLNKFFKYFGYHGGYTLL